MKKLPIILGGMLVVGILAMLFLKPDVDIQQKVASGPTKVGFVYLTNPGSWLDICTRSWTSGITGTFW